MVATARLADVSRSAANLQPAGTDPGAGATASRRSIAVTTRGVLSRLGLAMLIGAAIGFVAVSPARAQIRPDLPAPDPDPTETPASPGPSEPAADSPTARDNDRPATGPTGPGRGSPVAEDSGSSAVVPAILGGSGLAVGLAAGWVLGSRRRGRPAGPGASTDPRPSGARPDAGTDPTDLDGAGTTTTAHHVSPTGSGPPDTPGATDHRDQLVRTLIEVADMVSSEAVRTHLVRGLEQVGVTADLPAPGTPFDAARHRGVQAVPAADPTRDATVASCDRPGWTDGDRVLRTPEVVVHRWEGQP